jgi:hypothetical protein
MATAAEWTFINTVRAAEGVRQAAKTAAFATYAYVQANLAAYLTALETADNAFVTSVNAAANTAGAVGLTIPNFGTPNPGNVMIGSVGQSGPLGGNIATLGALA